MKIGVPKETADGERRVALVPDVVASLSKNDQHRRGRRAGAGRRPAIPTPSTRRPAPRSARPRSPGRRRDPPRRRPEHRGDRAARSGQILIGHLAPWTARRDQQRARRGGRHQFRDGGDPADDRAPGDGRALLAGGRRGLRGDADRRARVGPLLRDDDHRRRHRPAGEGAGARRRRRGPAGGRDGEAARARSSPASTSAAPPGSRSPRSADGRSNSTSSPTPKARAATRVR